MSLLVWLPLDGVIENKGSSNATVTNYGATVSTAGKTGSCYSFDGTNDYMEFSNLNIDSKRYLTLAFWCYSVNGNLYGVFTTRDTSLYHQFSLINTGLGFRDTRHSSWTTFSFEQPTANVWTHYAIVYSDGTWTVYKDGVKKREQIYGSATLNTSLNQIRVGRYQSSSNDAYFNGKINDFRIYDHALSAKEVKELSQALILHYPLDDISVGYDRLDYITFAGSQYFFIDKPAGQKSSMRIEMGIQPDTLSHSQPTFFSGRNSGVQFYRSSTSSLSLWTTSGSTSIGTFVAGKINSLIVDMTSSSVKTNLNGSVSTSTNTNAFNLLFSNNCDKFTVGGYNTGLYLFYGNMSYLNIYVDDELIFLGIPYKRKTDNVAGMYDLVTGQFFTSNGSQNFVAGNTMPGLSNRICDCSGFGNNGTITGTLSLDTNTPRYQNSTSFNGTSYIQVESPSTEVRTIVFWAKWNSIPSGQSVVFVDQKSKIGFGIMSTGLLCSTNGVSTKTFPKTGIVANQWYHFAIVNTSSTPTATTRDLYINGVKQTPTTSTTNWTFTLDYLQVGKRSTTSDGFAGKLSDFRMYSTALSGSEILDLYNSPVYIDDSGTIGAFEFVENSENGQSIEKTGVVGVKNFIEPSDNLRLMPDGSVFLKLLRHNNPASKLFTENNCWLNSSDPDLYSSLILLKNINWMKNLSEYEFLACEKLTSSGTETQVRWKQTSNPATTSSATGFLLVSGTAQYLTAGLANAGTHGCFDVDDANKYWCCCGSYSTYQDGVPGFTGVVTTGYIELFIRIPEELVKGYVDSETKFFSQSIVSGKFKEI